MFKLFKAHIVELDSGKFAVRKLTVFGWLFYDKQAEGTIDLWWRDTGTCRRWFECDTLEQAMKVCQIVKSPRVKRIVYVS
jgi:sarcosine oxidase delta subunit